MNKKILLGVVAFILSACSSDDATASVNGNQSPGEVQTSGYSDFISKTVSYPDDYAQTASHQGTVTEITYNTRDYVSGSNAARTNNAYVYLPYDYDESGATRYNILYLVHGHYGDASTFLTVENGLLRNMVCISWTARK